MDNNQNNFYQQQGSVGQVGSVAPKKNTGLIVGVVIGIIVLVGIFTTMNSNNGKKIDGKWTCTGTSGNLTIDANEKEGTVKMQLGVYSVDAKYKVSSKVKPTKKKVSQNYGIKDEILYEFPITEDFENACKNLKTIYEWDESLSEKDNLMHKIMIKDYGRQLTYDKNFSEAIDFYKNLKKNSYFTNDWYPFRQLTIVYDKTKDYRANLKNIRDIFFSGIYLNKYQYVWFTNKIKKLMAHIKVNDDEIQNWLDYYETHGSQNKSKLNKFLADQQDEMYKVLDKKSVDYRQESYGLEEIGMTYERVGNYELAIIHYKNIIDENKYNIYKFYQRICLCLEKLEDYRRELDAIKLYFTQPPQQSTEFSDEWFKKRLKKVNSKLGTHYTAEQLLR